MASILPLLKIINLLKGRQKIKYLLDRLTLVHKLVSKFYKKNISNITIPIIIVQKTLSDKLFDPLQSSVSHAKQVIFLD